MNCPLFCHIMKFNLWIYILWPCPMQTGWVCHLLSRHAQTVVVVSAFLRYVLVMLNLRCCLHFFVNIFVAKVVMQELQTVTRYCNVIKTTIKLSITWEFLCNENINKLSAMKPNLRHCSKPLWWELKAECLLDNIKYGNAYGNMLLRGLTFPVIGCQLKREKYSTTYGKLIAEKLSGCSLVFG